MSPGVPVKIGDHPHPLLVNFTIIEAGSPYDCILGANLIWTMGVHLNGKRRMLMVPKRKTLINRQEEADTKQSPLAVKAMHEITCDPLEMKMGRFP